MLAKNGWNRLTHPNTEIATVVWVENDFIYTTEYGCPVEEMTAQGYRIEPVTVWDGDADEAIYIIPQVAMQKLKTTLETLGIELLLTRLELNNERTVVRA